MNDGQIGILISEVQNNPSLWDIADRNYKNLKLKGQLWDKISVVLRNPKIILQNKWKSLVKKYKTELAKTKFSRSGDGLGDLYESPWPFFSALDFLRNTVTPAPSTGNLDSIAESEALQVPVEREDKVTSMSAANPFENNGTVNLKLLQEAFAAKDEMTEKKMAEEQDKQNMSFLTTLIPELRRVPSNQICHCRSALLKVVHHYAHKDEPWQEIDLVQIAKSTSASPRLPNMDSVPLIKKIKIEKENCVLNPLAESHRNTNMPIKEEGKSNVSERRMALRNTKREVLGVIELE